MLRDPSTRGSTDSTGGSWRATAVVVGMAFLLAWVSQLALTDVSRPLQFLGIALSLPSWILSFLPTQILRILVVLATGRLEDAEWAMPPLADLSAGVWTPLGRSLLLALVSVVIYGALSSWLSRHGRRFASILALSLATGAGVVIVYWLCEIVGRLTSPNLAGRLCRVIGRMAIGVQAWLIGLLGGAAPSVPFFGDGLGRRAFGEGTSLLGFVSAVLAMAPLWWYLQYRRPNASSVVSDVSSRLG